MTLREAIKVNKGKNIRVGATTAFIYILINAQDLRPTH